MKKADSEKELKEEIKTKKATKETEKAPKEDKKETKKVSKKAEKVEEVKEDKKEKAVKKVKTKDESEETKKVTKKSAKKEEKEVAEEESPKKKTKSKKEDATEEVENIVFEGFEEVSEKEEKKTRKTKKKYTNTNVYEEQEKTVTKWDYLKDWLKHSTEKPFRKFIGVIGVLLETFLCFIIKSLLIIVAYSLYFMSYVAKIIIESALAFLLIGIGALAFMIFIRKEINNQTVIPFISLISIFIAAYIFPFISRKILSKKVFELLYGKLDIYLFKLCVNYN